MQGIRESGDNGLPAAMKEGPISKAFVNLAEEVARQVAIRNATAEKTKPVEIKV